MSAEYVDEGPVRIPLYEEETWIFKRVELGLRKYLKHSKATPQEIYAIGKLLNSLAAMPLIDGAVNFVISVQLIPDSDAAELVLELDQLGVEFSLIERFDHGHGSNTVVDDVASFQCDGERNFGDGWSIGYWLNNWVKALSDEGTRLTIQDSSESSVPDWSLRADVSDFLADEEDDS